MAEDPIVCDTGPLIALSQIGKLDVLQRLYSRVIVPQAVLAEVSAGGGNLPGVRAISDAAWLEGVAGATPDPLLLSELGPGEAAVIATAYTTRMPKVLLDDRRARRVAVRAYGLKVKGTAGVLQQCL